MCVYANLILLTPWMCKYKSTGSNYWKHLTWKTNVFCNYLYLEGESQPPHKEAWTHHVRELTLVCAVLLVIQWSKQNIASVSYVEFHISNKYKCGREKQGNIPVHLGHTTMGLSSTVSNAFVINWKVGCLYGSSLTWQR